MKTPREETLPVLDPEARTQLRESRATVLERLACEPDDLKGLVLAEVIAGLDPDRDEALLAHRERFVATRPVDWRVRAKALGLDGLLYHLARGWSEAGIGAAAVPVLELCAAEIGEARATGVRKGHIDASYVPERLAKDRRVKFQYHPSGHLACVELLIDRLHEARLTLDESPGSGRYTIVEERGGSGTMIREAYRDGGVLTTLNTPWHDGVESTAKKAWTRWVEENLADLARLAASNTGARAGRARRRRAGGRGER